MQCISEPVSDTKARLVVDFIIILLSTNSFSAKKIVNLMSHIYKIKKKKKIQTMLGGLRRILLMTLPGVKQTNFSSCETTMRWRKSILLMLDGKNYSLPASVAGSKTLPSCSHLGKPDPKTPASLLLLVLRPAYPHINTCAHTHICTHPCTIVPQ